MGDLVVLSRPPENARHVLRSGPSADILFFTGVRYHRLPEEVVQPAAPVRRRSDKARLAAKAKREQEQQA